MRGGRVAAVAGLLLLSALPVAGHAQVTGRGAGRRADTTRAAGPRTVLRTADDSARARRDSLKNVPLVKWDPADSVGLELMSRKGYSVVRYRADEVRFGARDHTISLAGRTGDRAAVQREPTLLVADSIQYVDTSSTIRAEGDTIVMRDPTKGDDVVARGWMHYDIKTKEGTASDVVTSTGSSGVMGRSGQVWYVGAHRAGFAGDTTSRQGSAFYGRDGIITSCDDSFPHYDFKASEIKRVAGSVVVARPAILYIEGVPVMWLPFIFQDAREGRRSGMLTPRLGVTELVRNSPDYRRTVENIGYYFALSDYYDFSTWLDWRSSAKATAEDPGWVRFNGDLHYNWRDRFLSGELSASQMSLSSGSTQTNLSWRHQQDFSLVSHLTLNINYTTNTTVQRQTMLNPLAAVGTIASQANWQREMGPVSMSLGGSRRQYPGRPQVDQTLPTLSITSKPINITSWLLWTPSFNATTSSSLHMDSQGDFAYRYVTRPDGTLDSAKVDRSNKSSQLSFNTPLKVFNFQINSGIRANSTENDFPERRVIVDPADTSKRSTRVYQRTYLDEMDVTLDASLPPLPFVKGPWNIVPSVAVANVDPGAYFVRSERTGSRWVSQSKRLSYGLSISPTFFGLSNFGIGPVARFRHSITPAISYSYSPASKVSADYLAARGESPVGYLGNLAQNRVTLTLSQNFEAKLRQPPDSAALNPEGGRKIKLLSLQFTPLVWDFERQHKTGKSGFSTDQFGYTASSDLLPGFSFNVNYSLFQGSYLSDSAKFSPYLTNIGASFNLDAKSPIVRAVGRLFGYNASTKTTGDTSSTPSLAEQMGQGPLNQQQMGVAGQAIRGAPLEIPSGRGFTTALTFTKTQQRPPVGGNVIQYDPTLQCASLKDVNPIGYNVCVTNATVAPPQDTTSTRTTAGGSFVRYPSQMNVQARTTFDLTPKWSASWSTNYDMELRQFGMQTVSLQRELHDWRAVFGFTQAPNGNFAFSFYISLKAEPDIKFPYDRTSFRRPAGATIP